MHRETFRVSCLCEVKLSEHNMHYAETWRDESAGTDPSSAAIINNTFITFHHSFSFVFLPSRSSWTPKNTKIRGWNCKRTEEGLCIRDTHRNSLIGTCLIHSAGLKNSIIHRIHYSSPLHYQSAQRNKINPARNNSLWRDFFFLFFYKALSWSVQVCTQTQIRVYEGIITVQSDEQNNPL